MTTVNPSHSAEKPEVSKSKRLPRLILLLALISLVTLSLPMYLISVAIKTDNNDLKAKVSFMQQTLAVTPSPNPTELALSDTLFQIQSKKGELDALKAELGNQYIDWINVTNVIGSYDQRQMTLLGLTKTDNRLVLSGQAHDEAVVVLYGQMLENSGLFTRVIIQSLSLNRYPTPTSLPRTKAGGTPQPSLTPPPSNTYVEFVILVELIVGAS